MRSDVPEKPSRKPTFAEFLKWEAQTHDVLDFKKIYVDMAKDLHAGIVLSELTYWYLPAKNGGSRLRVRKEGQMWIAVRRWEWWDRCRMTPRQADRALSILDEADLIDKAIFKFDGEPTTHIALNEEVFLEAWAELAATPLVNPFLPPGKRLWPEGLNPSPEGEDEFTRRGSPLTEITTENTKKTPQLSTADAGVSAGAFISREREIYEQEIQFLAEEFAKYAELGPIPKRGEAKYADWRNGYKALLEICRENHIHPTDLALLCMVKRREQGFLAGRPGAYVKTAENLAMGLSVNAERDALLARSRLLYQEYVYKHPEPEA